MRTTHPATHCPVVSIREREKFITQYYFTCKQKILLRIYCWKMYPSGYERLYHHSTLTYKYTDSRIFKRLWYALQMSDTFLSILTLLYGGVALITLIAYYPTVHDLYRHKKPSANISTYVLWTVASGIGFLYGIFILPDVLFLVVAGINFFANLLVLFLRLRLPS